MLITSIQQAKRDKERVNVFIDNQFWAGLETNSVTGNRLYQGLEVTPELLSQILFRDNVGYLSRKLWEWCLIRPRSSRELKDRINEKLDKRLASHPGDSSLPEMNREQVTEAVLRKLAEQGYNDRHFAEWFAGERIRQGKSGRRKIVSELMGKGIDSRIIKDVLDTDSEGEAERASQLLMKKFGVASLKEIKDFNFRAKAYRFLASKGF